MHYWCSFFSRIRCSRFTGVSRFTSWSHKARIHGSRPALFGRHHSSACSDRTGHLLLLPYSGMHLRGQRVVPFDGIGRDSKAECWWCAAPESAKLYLPNYKEDVCPGDIDDRHAASSCDNCAAILSASVAHLCLTLLSHDMCEPRKIWVWLTLHYITK